MPPYNTNPATTLTARGRIPRLVTVTGRRASLPTANDRRQNRPLRQPGEVCCGHQDGSTQLLGVRLDEVATVVPPVVRHPCTRTHIHGLDPEDHARWQSPKKRDVHRPRETSTTECGVHVKPARLDNRCAVLVSVDERPAADEHRPPEIRNPYANVAENNWRCTERHPVDPNGPRGDLRGLNDRFENADHEPESCRNRSRQSARGPNFSGGRRCVTGRPQ